jgi:hypothetical protein
MNLACMRHFFLRIDNENHGPLTEEEITALIADGTLGADTPCAPVGSTEWVPLSTQFSFGSRLKVKRGVQAATEAESEIAATRIDPDLRKKLLIYGLADAATVDGFTQTQAVAAVKSREGILKAQCRRHNLAKTVSFLVLIPLAIVAGLYAPWVETTLCTLTSKAILEIGSAKVEMAGCHQSIKQLRWNLNRIKALDFDPPFGGTSVREAVVNRLRIDQEKSFFLEARFGSEELSQKFAKDGPPLYKGTWDNRQVHLLKEMPSGKLLELLDASEKSLKNPVGRGKDDWLAFDTRDGNEIEKLVKDATLATSAVDSNGKFRFESIPAINPSMSRQLVVEIPARKGRKMFATFTSDDVKKIDWNTDSMPESHYVDREEYSVVKKVAVGGRTLKATITTRYHSFNVTRVSRIWRFIAIARKNDKDAVFVLIEEKDIEIFENAMKDDKFDHAKLASFRCFMEPVESPVPAGLDGP